MKELRDIIDTWNMIEKYDIKGWAETENSILVPEKEFERLLNSVKNRRYILNLVK